MSLEEAMNYVRHTVLRREKKRPVKNHVMPISLLCLKSDEEIDSLVRNLLADGYLVLEEGRRVGHPGTGHLRIDWSQRHGTDSRRVLS